MMFRYTLEELIKLQGTIALLRSMEDDDNDPVDPDLLPFLVGYVAEDMRYRGYKEPDLLFEQPFTSACGCMGPQDGYPLCNCAMRRKVHYYRYEIAIKLVELGIVHEFSLEMSELQRLKETLETIVSQKRDHEINANFIRNKQLIDDFINSDGRVKK